MKRERRKFTNEFKAEVALEAIKEKLTMVEFEVVGFGWTKLV
jgi:transposase-like protein